EAGIRKGPAGQTFRRWNGDEDCANPRRSAALGTSTGAPIPAPDLPPQTSALLSVTHWQLRVISDFALSELGTVVNATNGTPPLRELVPFPRKRSSYPGGAPNCDARSSTGSNLQQRRPPATSGA